MWCSHAPAKQWGTDWQPCGTVAGAMTLEQQRDTCSAVAQALHSQGGMLVQNRLVPGLAAGVGRLCAAVQVFLHCFRKSAWSAARLCM